MSSADGQNKRHDASGVFLPSCNNFYLCFVFATSLKLYSTGCMFKMAKWTQRIPPVSLFACLVQMAHQKKRKRYWALLLFWYRAADKFPIKCRFQRKPKWLKCKLKVQKEAPGYWRSFCYLLPLHVRPVVRNTWRGVGLLRTCKVQIPVYTID